MHCYKKWSDFFMTFTWNSIPFCMIHQWLRICKTRKTLGGSLVNLTNDHYSPKLIVQNVMIAIHLYSSSSITLIKTLKASKQGNAFETTNPHSFSNCQQKMLNFWLFIIMIIDELWHCLSNFTKFWAVIAVSIYTW